MVYTGYNTITHVVKEGETLTSIAKKYHFKDYKPIFRYNQSLRLVRNPDKISTGQKIIIPRTPKGYDKIIRKLEQLKVEMATSGDQIGYELDSINNNFEEYKAKLDFASDAIQVVAPLGVAKGISKISRVKNLEKVVNKKSIMGRILSESDELVKNSKKDLTGKLKDTIVGTQGGNAYKLYQTGKKTKDSINTFKKPKAGKLDKFLSVADIVLDYITPSHVADMIVKASTGETVGETMETQRKHIETTVNRQLINLNKKIKKMQQEKALIYGTSGNQNTTSTTSSLLG